MSVAQRVLVVDDERLIREMLSRALGAKGIEVDTAADGVEALERIRGAPPDLVLLDLMMPKMDGFDVLEAVRADPDTRSLQMIVLTARGGQEVLQEALEAGADDYIAKPFHLGEVLARVQAHLRIAAYAAQREQQRRDDRTLLDISHRLTGRLDVQTILQDVAGMVAEVLHTERCSVVLVEQDEQVGRVVAASDDAGLTDREIALEGYPEIRRVLETRQPVIVADVTADPLFDPVKDQVARLSVRSCALFPMMEGDRCIGVLFLRSAQAWERFGERETSFGQIVANATAVAVSNARLFSALKAESTRISHARAVVEQRLRTVQRYEDFFENSADGMFIIDARGRVLFMNRPAEIIIGVGRAEMVGRDFRTLCAGDCSGPAELLRLLHAGDFSRRVDLRLANARLLSISAARVPGDEAYSLTLRDVTEERRLADQLAEARDFLQSLVDATPDAVVATDLAGNVRVFNKAAERLFGRGAEDVVGKLHVSALYLEGGAAEVMALLRSDEHGGRNRITTPLRREVLDAGGRAIPVLMTASVVQVDGREVATVGILRDLRDRIAMEAQLNETQERLQESEKMALLAELAGAMAHELNQPLTSVMGYAELLQRRLAEDDPNQRPARTIHREAERMATIVRRIGRLTRYETKPYVGDARIIDLEASADDSIDGRLDDEDDDD
ncbi:MAG: response regulator [Myxococcales bacterium]|nr:response regulator [Myxococcales bacterium]MCB9534780.1 response regulator [Myxococcales bacterium]